MVNTFQRIKQVKMAFTPSVNAAGTRRKNEVGQKWINLLKQLSFI
jgi:ABC-type transport system involved in Fe-S cluster assembly fused permease/ATPase subunit